MQPTGKIQEKQLSVINTAQAAMRAQTFHNKTYANRNIRRPGHQGPPGTKFCNKQQVCPVTQIKLWRIRVLGGGGDGEKLER